MNRARALSAAAAAVAVLALLTAAVLPGVVADPETEPTRPGYVDVVESQVAAGEVTGTTAELTLRTHLDHRGPPADNVTVAFRATDADSGLLVTGERVDVGTVDGEGERVVERPLTVPREGSYRLSAIVYRDGERLDEVTTTVSGVSALTPPYARTNVTFAERGFDPISVSVAEAAENRTNLRIDASLTAVAPVDDDGLAVRLVVRQVESNLVTARETADVGAIEEGQTATVGTEIAVPAGYNYFVDAVLVRDGVVVDDARGAVNLDPQRTIDADEEREDVGFEVADFERERQEEPRQAATQTSSGDGPGFGVGAAVAALTSVALLGRRWSE